MRLKEPRSTLGNFLSVSKRLKQTLGPILVQLRPHWNVNTQRLDAFLAAAPRGLRFAVEFRDERWLCPEVYKVLERYRAALCIHDMIKNHPRLLTAEWTYLRYHGDHYSGSYSEVQLSREVEWIDRQLSSGLDVFGYFKNDPLLMKYHPIQSCRALDTRSTAISASFNKEALDKIPSARDPWVILEQTPGVLMSGSNVGGNLSGQQTSFSAMNSGSYSPDRISCATESAQTARSPRHGRVRTPDSARRRAR